MSINEITQLDKDELFQIYTELLDVPDHWIKDAQNEFYNSILKQKPELMPYWLVVTLIEKNYITIEE